MALLTLQEHQIEAVEYGLKNPYSILALRAGLGKTFVALEIWDRTGRPPMIVVCPAYLVLNWKLEIAKYFGDKDDLVVTAVKTGSEIPKDFSETNIVLISYELAQKAEPLFERCKMFVADEAHLLKSMKAKRTEKIHKFIFENSTPRVHFLSGTPIKNRVEEYYSLLALCHYRPDKILSKFLEIFPDSVSFADYFSFRQEREIDVGYRRVKIVSWSGLQRIDELKEYLKPIYLRINDSNLKLPPVIFKDIVMSDKNDIGLQKAFEAFELMGTSVMPGIKRESAIVKSGFTKTYVENLFDEGIEPVLIYSDFVDPVAYFGKELKIPVITGATPIITRARIVNEFQAGMHRGIAATIGSLSTGVTLTRAKHLVLNDISWVPGDMDQVIARINRIGQSGECTIHRILGSFQDEYIMKAVAEKAAVIAKAT